MRTILVVIAILAIVIGGIIVLNTRSSETDFHSFEESSSIRSDSNMQIKSSAFEHNQHIPAKYTCDGENINPPLGILDVPEGAKA